MLKFCDCFMYTWEEGIFCVVNTQKMKRKKSKENTTKSHKKKMLNWKRKSHQVTKEDSKRRKNMKLQNNQKILNQAGVSDPHLSNVKEWNYLIQRHRVTGWIKNH